jgi:hypothetical protein
MKIPLQAWYDEWLKEHQDTDLIYVSRDAQKRVSLPQVHFVRDTLAPLLWADTLYDDLPCEPPPREDCRLTAWVIGEHRSKSVRLPVYLLERPDKGLRVMLRYNYFDWKLSVESEVPLDHELFSYLFHTTPPVEPDYTGNELASCYFEGFPEDQIYGYQTENPRRWSASIGNDRALWMTILLCMIDLGVVKRASWTTRASHQEQFAAKDAARKRREEREKAKAP